MAHSYHHHHDPKGQGCPPRVTIRLHRNRNRSGDGQEIWDAYWADTIDHDRKRNGFAAWCRRRLLEAVRSRQPGARAGEVLRQPQDLRPRAAKAAVKGVRHGS